MTTMAMHIESFRICIPDVLYSVPSLLVRWYCLLPGAAEGKIEACTMSVVGAGVNESDNTTH